MGFWEQVDLPHSLPTEGVHQPNRVSTHLSDLIFKLMNCLSDFYSLWEFCTFVYDPEKRCTNSWCADKLGIWDCKSAWTLRIHQSNVIPLRVCLGLGRHQPSPVIGFFSVCFFDLQYSLRVGPCLTLLWFWVILFHHVGLKIILVFNRFVPWFLPLSFNHIKIVNIYLGIKSDATDTVYEAVCKMKHQ